MTGSTYSTAAWGGFAILAGILSPLMLLSLTLAPPFGMALALLSGVPLIGVGLSLGWQACTLSAVIATSILVATDLSGGIGYAITTAMPAPLFTRLAGKARRTSIEGENETWEWYPAGRLLAIVTLTAAAGTTLWIVVLELGTGGAHQFVEQAAARILAVMPPDQLLQLGEAGIEESAAVLADLIFLTAGTAWIVSLLINGSIAQALLRASGHNLRPGFAFDSLSLPRAMMPLAAISLGAAFLPGLWGLIGLSVLPIFLLPYFLLGLAVIHAISRAWSAGRVFLFLVYGLVLVMGWPVVPIMILGLVEEAAGIRARFGHTAPD